MPVSSITCTLARRITSLTVSPARRVESFPEVASLTIFLHEYFVYLSRRPSGPVNLFLRLRSLCLWCQSPEPTATCRQEKREKGSPVHFLLPLFKYFSSMALRIKNAIDAPVCLLSALSTFNCSGFNVTMNRLPLSFTRPCYHYLSLSSNAIQVHFTSEATVSQGSDGNQSSCERWYQPQRIQKTATLCSIPFG